MAATAHTPRKDILKEGFHLEAYDSRLQWAFPPTSHSNSQQGGLVVHTAGETDYWERTHYGFRNQNGHFLHLPGVRGDFCMATSVSMQPQQRFDQAGLMVWISKSCWLKTSVEYGGPGRPSQLGVVVTNCGYSDWSTMDFPDGVQLALRVRREGSDYIVEACIPQESLSPAAAVSSSGDGSSSSSFPIRVGSGSVDSPAIEWTQLRICHLMEDVSPAGVGKDGHENVEFGLQLQAACEVLPLSGVCAGLYACSPKPGGGFQARFDRLHIVSGRLPGHM